MSSVEPQSFDLGQWFSILTSAQDVEEIIGPLLQDRRSVLQHLIQRQIESFDDNGNLTSSRMDQVAPDLVERVSPLLEQLQAGYIDEVEFRERSMALVSTTASIYDGPDSLHQPLEYVGAYAYVLGRIEKTADAYAVFYQQMFVLYMTYAEMMMKDFFRCLFSTQPLNLYQLLESEPDRQRLQIDLKTLINASDIQSIVSSIIERNVGFAVSGLYKDQARRIKRLTRCSLGQPLVEKLDIDYRRRNDIVHEGAANIVSRSDVEALRQTVDELRLELGKIAEVCGVRVHDPGRWLDDVSDDALEIDEQ